MLPVTTFQQYLQSAFTTGPLSTDEVIEFVLPLFEEVLGFHEAGQVGSFDRPETVFLTDGRLDIDENFTHDPLSGWEAVQKLLDAEAIQGYEITGRVLVNLDLTTATSSVSNLEVQMEDGQKLPHPAYLPGYQCYEMLLKHHDARTDIFCLGLILGSVVMGLNLYRREDLDRFASYRVQPAGLNPRMHPTICALVTEMTELDRRKRSVDLGEVIQRLRNYRDYDPQRNTDLTELAATLTSKTSDRKGFILSKLRNRLFDTSRRNRLLYYKANARFVNLTVSSVPLVLHYQSINPQLLFTWNDEISKLIIKQSDLALNKYLRFEDHPYLNSQLNAIRHQSENDKKEFGFSQLKLVVAFLHWHNLKENARERIQSPLLLLPVEIERKKSLKEERFTLKIKDNAAIINPVLANHLKDLYGIVLPDSIDFDDISMEQFFEMLQAQIDAARQGVKLSYIDKPRIKIVHTVARQTVNNYRKRLKQKGTPTFHQVEYSYNEENYRPLGLELFRQRVEPRLSTLEFLLGNLPPAASTANFAAEAAALKSTFQLTDGDENPYHWDFDICNIVLGNFNYKKMSLVRDYNAVAEGGVDHNVFEELFSKHPKEAVGEAINNNPAEWYHVVSADPTQSKAVLQARTGKSYIIQGPPGTGKSQTITNLIADFMARGKTVLFICEKRAALDVVYYRLQQSQLSELCCYIHDSQADKKEFIKDLRTVYEDFLKNRMDLAAVMAQRNDTLQRLLRHVDVLKQYHTALTSVPVEAGVPVRGLIETLIQLKPHLPGKDVEGEELPVYRSWVQFGSVITELSDALDKSGAEISIAKHPFRNLSNTLVRSENPFSLLDSLTGSATNAISRLVEVVSQNNIPKEHATGLEQIKNLIEDSLVLEGLARTGNLKLVDPNTSEARKFETELEEYRALQKSYQEAVHKNGKWRDKFEKDEISDALAIAQKFEKSFWRFFNGSWRRLKKQMEQSYDFSAHKLKPAYSQILQLLQDEYREGEKADQSRTSIQGRYRVDDIESVYNSITVLRQKQGDKEVDFLLAHPRSNELVLQLSKLHNTLQQLEVQLAQCLYEFEGKSVQQISDELTTILANKPALKDLLPALRKFSELPADLQGLLRRLPLTPVQAQAAMAKRTLEEVYRGNLAFGAASQATLQNSVREIESAYHELLQLNSTLIRAQRRQLFLTHYDISNASATVLSQEQKIFKKEYSNGRRILEHELSKSTRYKSIRELASGESGKVLRDIKPVWLMSPLSVSDSLPLDTSYFDVVIFDEASQITLEEGIPALFRAPQSIIVGDDKQMPPSNFFNARSDDPEDLEAVEGETEDEILSADADSLLVQGARKLNGTMLSWHYRSRHEALISYSNHAFYDAGLLTIPDRTIQSLEKPLLEVKSPEEGAANAGRLLSGSISYHYLAQGLYEARSNKSEARYIAQMVRKLLLDGAPESIGIVAFSQEQQGAIEEAIDELALADKPFEELLEKAFARKDEGQFTGLFIKNLENVQGDERDIIIMSVCYGFDSNGKMLMNFGPINKKGGEKRLNVIFSRAKKHMAVVASIRHQHITNEHNDGANYFKRFLHYAEMVSTGNLRLARTILDGLVKSDGKTQQSEAGWTGLVQEIKVALERKGYKVDTMIGQSTFKCSLAVREAGSVSHYKLGILVDDSAHYQNGDLVEQYYQRPAILKSFGWEVITVFAKDWWESPEGVLQKITGKLEGKESEGKTEIPNPEPKPAKESDKPFAELISADGARFWRIMQAGAQLQVTTGKMGTAGLVQLYAYGSEAEASVQLDTLVEKQLAEGYSKTTAIS
ncbi:AAA domain-containing protein [Flaviaesturariibacter aridisoli]|uniref:DUF4011 domain-containing protein n=1 Tax=Flaviaesturariibacter aridisoli TaxID=2545761 RepID=A0A4R4DTA3_9BACT|nr:AAA domain-containing protein [Flaviaesturariibacter aridisoli]TCZ65036.1 DUF4011 domain-containing protein [Flaviaesturariibacter aridisoli]